MKEISPANIVIPLYRTMLSADEWCSLEQCFSVLKGHSATFVAPEGLDLSPVLERFPDCRVERFDPSYFEGRAGYNHLMLSPEFYERFLEWEYILIYQTDAFVFRDELSAWCAKEYDYIGAPWMLRPLYSNLLYKIISRIKSALIRKNHTERHITRNKIGNGGFSLRRTRAVYELLTGYPKRVAYYKKYAETSRYYEDVFFAIEALKLNPRFRIPPVSEALHFSFDTYPALCYRQNGKHLPFGCHGFMRRRRYRFWKPFLTPFPCLDKSRE